MSYRDRIISLLMNGNSDGGLISHQIAKKTKISPQTTRNNLIHLVNQGIIIEVKEEEKKKYKLLDIFSNELIYAKLYNYLLDFVKELKSIIEKSHLERFGVINILELFLDLVKSDLKAVD